MIGTRLIFNNNLILWKLTFLVKSITIVFECSYYFLGERMTKYIFKFTFIFVMFIVVACSGSTPGEVTDGVALDLEGELLVWHTWDGNEREVLSGIFDEFMELYPSVTIIEEFYPRGEIEDRYQTQVEAGLGPDLLIAPSDWASDLAENDLIQDISVHEINTDIYLTNAINILKDGDKLYGLPLSLNTFILYYNKTMFVQPPKEDNSSVDVAQLIQDKQKGITDTETLNALNDILSQVEQKEQPEDEILSPPKDIEELFQQINKGKRIAILTDFYGAFWGVGSFGGQLFDERSRVVLNQGGFANWLGWLKRIQDSPYVVLSRNQSDLVTLFTTGEVDYYVGSSQELSVLQETIGKELLGAVRLPARRNKPATPFLQAEVLMFNKVASNKNTQLALQLAQFLTSTKEQRELALKIGKLPANKHVNVDSRLSPLTAELIAQSKSSVPINVKDLSKFDDVQNYGDDIYTQVLIDEISPSEAALLITEQVNDKYNMRTLAATSVKNCDVKGGINLWNTWTGERRLILSQIQDNFMRRCLDTYITITDVPVVDFHDRYLQSLENDQAPDMFTASSHQIRRLGHEELIADLSDILDPDFLQRLLPVIEQSIRYDNQPHGIPINFNVMALYYNTSLVQDPPAVLDDILIMASPEQQFALPTGFEEGYWGISAFGESFDSPLFDEKGRLIIGQQGLTEWLDWLQTAKDVPGIVLSADMTELETLFIEEQAAFLVGDSSQLEKLQEALGIDKVGVALLPSGAPLLAVDVLLINPYSAPEVKETALKFAQFMTDVENQVMLLEQANKIPVNTNVSTADNLAANSFVKQANNAIAIPNVPQVNAVFEWGNMIYEGVMDGNTAPEVAVQEFTNIVDITNGFEVADATEETEGVEACTDDGIVNLWHSWTEPEQLAWQQVISDFVEYCPNLQVATTFITKTIFTEQLSATLGISVEISPPDFFIGSHALLETYQKKGLVRSITPLVPEDSLTNYLPRSVTGLRVGKELYGLPQALHLPTFYYRADLIEEPAKTFSDLQVHAQRGLTVAINIGFYDVLWGASAFNCTTCQSGQFFNEQNEFLLTEEELAEWHTWLKTISQTEGFVLSTNQAKLEQMFIEGKIVYLIADDKFLGEAQATLGVAKVKVTPLPHSMSDEFSKPFLNVDGFLFYQEATETQVKLAIKFAQFATSNSNQTLLMELANFVPTNSLAIIKAESHGMVTIISGIDNSILLPSESRRKIIEESDVFTIFDDLR